MSDNIEVDNSPDPGNGVATDALPQHSSPSPPLSAPSPLKEAKLDHDQDDKIKSEQVEEAAPTTAISVSDIMEVSQSPIIETPVTRDSVQSALPPVTVSHISDEEDMEDAMNEDLSPPPDSPMDEVLEDPAELSDDAETSGVSSPAAVNDMIVVHTHVTKSSPPVDAEDEDVAMGNGDDSVILERKRKRTFAKYAETDDVDDDTVAEHESRPLVRERPKKHGSGNASNVIIGYWRDSTLPNPADKHVVIGFIDTRERLRTMTQFRTRDGRVIDKTKYPVPKGPGGSWVTFEKIVFDDHLIGLNQHLVKEFVRIRAGNAIKNETPLQKAAKDKEAVELARQQVAAHPPPTTNVPPPVAYGATLPDTVVVPHPAVQESKRRKLPVSSPAPAPATPQPAKQIPGTRPTNIQVGYWKASSAADPIDKHVVYGVIGTNDTFRYKLGRETRDGRQIIDHSFPTGAGALWKVQFHECELEPHLKNLGRYEIKEYCRVRQRQIDQGENPDERVENEAKAVIEAQQRVQQNTAAGCPQGPPLSQPDVSSSLIDNDDSVLAAEDSDDAITIPPRPNGLRGRKTLPDIEFREANRGTPVASPAASKKQSRIQEAARGQVERVARVQGRRTSRRDDLNEGASEDVAASRRAEFDKQVSTLHQVWTAQEASRVQATGQGQDAMFYAGIKYERKQSGPLAGKLASPGVIITIDGEDYIEYRVLMKPSFC
ncbi:hypothetical protein QBC38DRAFT_169890 [Podospora fimiseda]|uniref:Uncharacterized protein n=1 Tax=Podospora fimiseda TaxID=252190 RepID=A0AAN7BR53_9PEZI|nr:hypothetical protein QBC38DRAFT_169890 [Podospora fimiseda]